MASSKKEAVADKRPMAGRIVRGLFRSRNHIWDNDHRIVASHGLTWSQFVTLIALAAAPERTLAPTDLYGAAQVSSGGMTKMLHGLTEAGYVARLANPKDKRSRLVTLLPAGEALSNAISNALLETNTAVFKGILSDAECEQLATLLQKLLAGLESSHREP
ncbi:MAG: MarR family transcriptional regulator [Pseudomonadota bacterium]